MWTSEQDIDQNTFGFRRSSQCLMVEEQTLDRNTSKPPEGEKTYEPFDGQVLGIDEPIGTSSLKETSANNTSSNTSNTEQSSTSAIVLDKRSKPNLI